MSTATLSYTYAAALALGGIAGASKGSLVSLIAAGGSAAIIAGLEFFQTTSVQLSSAAQAVVAGGLAAMMGKRFSESGKVMPAGIVAGLSAVLFVLYVARAAGGAAGAKRA